MENRKKKLINFVDIKPSLSEAVKNSEYLKDGPKEILTNNSSIFSRNSADIGLNKKYFCELEFENSYKGEVLNRKPDPTDATSSDEVGTEVQEMDRYTTRTNQVYQKKSTSSLKFGPNITRKWSLLSPKNGSLTIQ